MWVRVVKTARINELKKRRDCCMHVCALFPPLAGELTIPHIVQEMQKKQRNKKIISTKIFEQSTKSY